MKSFLFFCFFLFAHLFTAQELNLIPYPQKVEVKEGFFEVNENVKLIGDKNSFEYQYFKNNLNKFSLKKSKSTSQKTITLMIDKPLKVDLKRELKNDYQISIDNEIIILKGKDSKGLFHGIQTLLQLFATSKDGKIPNLEISDFPKFDYRGMHLDVARHFFGVEDVKKYLDYLAMYKYNKFHWHLTDDQGWRIEIKKYPKLTEIGAWRNGSQIGPYADLKFDDKKYGGFYTQEQIKEVVEYAKKLHIDVIPEIEMPGHAVAAIASYPELSCMKGNFEVSKKWGVEENIFCPTEYTFQFLEHILDEVMQLFPYQYIHIGGDEAPKSAWKESVYVQNLMKEKGFTNEMQVQSYFITRIEKYLNAKGRKIIGWDEILEGGLAPNATVMSWTGIEGGIHAAKTGHKAIMTPTSTNYFDYYQGNPDTEPLAFGGDLRLSKVYNYNPIPKELAPEEAKFIWGTQGNIWSEYILDFKGVEHMMFPRMMALSEVAWGTSNPEKYKDFENRVIHHFSVLDTLGIAYSKAIFEVVGKAKTDNGKIFYELSSANDPKNIRYTLDGSEPSMKSLVYEKPIELFRSTIVKAAYFETGVQKSPLSVQEFIFSKSTGKSISLDIQPNEAYSVGGTLSLVNGIKGSPNNYGKSWLGFSGNNAIATLNFGTSTEISTVKIGVLERQGSWIYYPKSVQVLVSENGTDFREIQSLSSEEIIKSNGNLQLNFPKQETKFVKVIVENYGEIPKGNEGAGNKAWLFVDEIAVD